jgi:hypothetical protein
MITKVCDSCNKSFVIGRPRKGGVFVVKNAEVRI